MRDRSNKYRIGFFKAAALVMTAVILIHHFPDLVVKADTKIDELEQ